MGLQILRIGERQYCIDVEQHALMFCVYMLVPLLVLHDKGLKTERIKDSKSHKCGRICSVPRKH